MSLTSYILEFKIGNYSNFKTFYDLTNKQIYLTALSILKNSDDALDIMQDVYLNFLNNIHNVKEKEFHIGYLVRISRNLSINFYNRQKREIKDENFILNSGFEEDYLHDYKVKAILDLLDLDIEREIITYHIILDYKFRDIASIVDKPLGTVLWIYNKAIKKLRERMKQDD